MIGAVRGQACSASAFSHLGHRMLDAEEDAAQKHPESAIPVLDRGLFERSKRASEPGVVVDDVETAELLDRPRDHRLYVRLG